MGLTMHERHAVTRELTCRYQKGAKKQRGQILDEFTKVTGYTRCYARFILRNCGRKLIKLRGNRRVVFTCAQGRSAGAKRRRPKLYGTKTFLLALQQLWALSDGLCGKRLAAFLHETIPHLERCGTLVAVTQGVLREQLLTISAATLDRLLAPTKRQARLKGRSGTRPGTLLKQHIPIRTFADWNDAAPGFCEVDLVAHDGGAAVGEYCHTLTLTDVATAWTETEAVQNKAQIHVFAALQEIRRRMPFPLLGLDSDNGSEFINHELWRYCDLHQITFTRSRAYKKNDNCYVEQKNNSVVRRTVAYYRYDRPEQQMLLHEIYHLLRLYANFFLPVMKLKEKIRTGSHLTRHYDSPKTPFKRLLEHPQLSDVVKKALLREYNTLNIVTLKRELNRLQDELFHSALQPPVLHKSWGPGPDHPWRKSDLYTTNPKEYIWRNASETIARTPTQKAGNTS
jgi:hypothetical protein